MRRDNSKMIRKDKYQKEISKFRQLEEKLKTSIIRNPTRPIDYALITQLQHEAAKTIQYAFRFKKSQIQIEGEYRHGSLVDRTVQTDPITLQ